MVMYAGTVVEEARAEDLFDDPRHPYTLGLLNALPAYQAEKKVRRLTAIPGFPPNLTKQLVACPFYSRCSFAIEKCSLELPELQPVSANAENNHRMACFVDTRQGSKAA
jgi:oligopeptide/dipeptide ABC transporter ATP-binding protein